MYAWRIRSTKFKQDFLRRIGDFNPFQQLLDLLPDVAFFIKDRQSRFVMKNLRAVECCGAASEEETIGKTDRDYFSVERAALYVEQDRRVMETGQPIINAVCPVPEKGSNALIVFSKLPLRDRLGRIIGLAGIWREVRGLRAPPLAVSRISRVVEMMHERYGEALSISRLAAAAGASRSQLDRQFQQLFGAAPREYLLRVRVNAACRLLAETDRKATDIAQETGFFDQSHFSRTFRRLVGLSPQAYRRRQPSRRHL